MKAGTVGGVWGTVLAVAGVENAPGNFIGGVERFTGTVPDTTTLTVGPHEFVRAKVTYNEAMDSYRFFGLTLTNKSRAGYEPLNDTAYFYLWDIAAGWGNRIAAGVNTIGTQYPITSVQHPVGTTYVYKVVRQGTASAVASVYEADGVTPVGTPQGSAGRIRPGPPKPGSGDTVP